MHIEEGYFQLTVRCAFSSSVSSSTADGSATLLLSPVVVPFKNGRGNSIR